MTSASRLMDDAAAGCAGGELGQGEAETRAREELAQARRVLHTLGLMDLAGHLSVRLPAGQGILVTPGPNVSDVGRLTADQPVKVSLETATADGLPLDQAIRQGRVPAQVYADLAIYARRPDVSAVLFAAPPNLMRIGMAGVPVWAMTHTNAELAHGDVGVLRHDGLITGPTAAASLVEALGGGRFCHFPGVAFVACAPSLLEVVRSCDVFELMAHMTMLARAAGTEPRQVTPAESRELVAQRPVESVPSRDPRKYYEGVDEYRRPAAPLLVDAEDIRYGELRARLATACRVLYAQGTLVSFYEHLSHRAPDTSEFFLMSPAKHFGTMTARDIGLVSTYGTCDGIEGPYPPAPFRWLHRDLLQARPEVDAIVHTHEVFGRVLQMSGSTPVGAHRNGASSARRPIPVLETPSLVFSEEHRDAVCAMAADSDIVHVFAHGTDFLAASLEQAVVAAIHREQLCAAELEAGAVGALRPLGAGTIRDLEVFGPTARQWWEYYLRA